MNDEDSDREGFEAGVSSSQGDPRVLLVMNAVLSTLFGWTVVWGLSFLDVLEFSPINVATAAILLFALTYLVTMS
ncbi:hypothetical protein C488_02610 [Natrinema pellirubrum DSM 15624]|uniref:DUF8107 domain-containing protein n=2 Tax=Natrinema TaxID=88723 RepID=L0JJG1_NATP1|nr:MULTISPECIES: hypothetical protein [Natrinema]ELZ12381.1 hypothetical protein C478_09906 [Natrinema thermotolerans DSM 11552]AGB30973.1 hypothetical protein Natpe_1061 [Natrinema pellirubrum DSM 15624]ELY80644.1 hypothetical protein C488_02610 [Natrinema pellirubrum DSM 15624]QCC59792.1 hypothetical protein DVR14_14615 [Natrinema thermotolerans]WMT06781.1 hypothetical protein NP511_15480 [Natrinema thermotolerans]